MSVFYFWVKFTTNHVFDFPSHGESFFTLSNAAGRANDKRTSQSQSVYLIFYSKYSKFLEDQRLPHRNVVFLFWQWVSFFRQFAIIFSLYSTSTLIPWSTSILDFTIIQHPSKQNRLPETQVAQD